MALTPVTQPEIDTFNQYARAVYPNWFTYAGAVTAALVDDVLLQTLMDTMNIPVAPPYTLDQFRNLAILAYNYAANAEVLLARNAANQANLTTQTVNADRLRAEQKYAGLYQRIITALNYE